MKQLFSIITIGVVLSLGLGACIKNDDVVWTGSQVELDATSWNANAAGLTYPIIGRIPGYGRVANATDSTLRRYPQTIKVRINLIGAQLNTTKAETVGYEVMTTSPISTFLMPATMVNTANPLLSQLPFADTATLAVSNAVAGTHYTALSGLVNFPANSSFAFIDIPILRPAATPASGRFLGIRLNNNGTLKPAVNYRELGLVIDQR